MRKIKAKYNGHLKKRFGKHVIRINRLHEEGCIEKVSGTVKSNQVKIWNYDLNCVPSSPNPYVATLFLRISDLDLILGIGSLQR